MDSDLGSPGVSGAAAVSSAIGVDHPSTDLGGSRRPTAHEEGTPTRTPLRHRAVFVMILILLGGGAFAFSDWGGSSSAARQAPSPCVQPAPSVVQLYPDPPPGFNPLVASTSDLHKYGFPPPPDQPRALAAWQDGMRHYRRHVRPEFCESAVSHDPLRRAAPR